MTLKKTTAPGLMLCVYVICVACSGCNNNNLQIKSSDLVNFEKLHWQDSSDVLVIDTNYMVESAKLILRRGKYVLRFTAEAGLPNNAGPRFMIGFGEYVLKDISLEKGKKEYQVKFELPEKVDASLQLKFQNDWSDSTINNNILLHFPISIRTF